MAFCSVFVSTFVCLALLSGSVAFSCLEGRCLCIENGIIICKTVTDQSVLDFTDFMLQQYKEIIVSKHMDCENSIMLEERTNLKVINKNCDNMINQPSPVVIASKVNDGHRIGHYIYETFTCILVIISLLLSAKLKHNMAPLVTRLPRTYTSNTTFIRNFFKVCVFYFSLF
jgi:type III secretory pathway component EscR